MSFGGNNQHDNTRWKLIIKNYKFRSSNKMIKWWTSNWFIIINNEKPFIQALIIILMTYEKKNTIWKWEAQSSELRRIEQRKQKNTKNRKRNKIVDSKLISSKFWFVWSRIVIYLLPCRTRPSISFQNETHSSVVWADKQNVVHPKIKAIKKT